MAKIIKEDKYTVESMDQHREWQKQLGTAIHTSSREINLGDGKGVEHVSIHYHGPTGRMAHIITRQPYNKKQKASTFANVHTPGKDYSQFNDLESFRSHLSKG